MLPVFEERISFLEAASDILPDEELKDEAIKTFKLGVAAILYEIGATVPEAADEISKDIIDKGIITDAEMSKFETRLKGLKD